MSGGHFNYDQDKIGRIADEIQYVIDNNNNEGSDEWGNFKGRGYNDETVKHLKDSVYYLRLAQIYAQRADWLLSGDDGEDNFVKRLNEEVCDLMTQQNQERGEYDD